MTDADIVDGASVQADDLPTIEAMLSAVFGDVELSSDRADHASLRMGTHEVPGIRVVRWMMSGACGGSLDRREDDHSPLLLGVRLAGGVELSSETEPVDAESPYLCPEFMDFRTSASDIVNLIVDREVIDAQARALVGSGDFVVRFRSTAPIDPTAGHAWRNTVAYLTRTVADVEHHPQSGLLAASMVDLVTRMILQTYPNTALDTIAYGSRRTSAAVERAIAFVDEHLAEPIRIADLAEAARIGTRGLHAAFQRDVGRTPMSFVRARRMVAVHDELLRSDPQTTDPRSVMLQWGLSTRARSAQQYFQEFGESPLDTLLR